MNVEKDCLKFHSLGRMPSFRQRFTFPIHLPQETRAIFL